MEWSNAEREILKRLAGEQAEIARLPVHGETAELWRRMNDLDPVRPMVWINEIPWHEMNVNDELTLGCTDRFARALEAHLRMTIYQWRHMPGDMIVENYLECPLAISSTGFGVDEDVDIVKTDDSNPVVSRHFNPRISKPEDVEIIKTPVITHDQDATEERCGLMIDVFGGIIEVRKTGNRHFWFTPWDNLIRVWGVEAAMMDLVLRPDMVNEAVSRFVKASLEELRQYEELNLLSLGHGSNRVGSGGYAHTGSLPGEPFDPAHVRPSNMWGCSNAQIFSAVSPEMHWEFAVKHDMPWLERWGLNYYGCCEPLDIKMEIMRKIPNLRKISMSPLAKMERAVAEAGSHYVISRKPNPAILAESTWNPGRARAELEDDLPKARGCAMEVIMKDISTVRYEPARLWEWEKIAMDVARKLAK